MVIVFCRVLWVEEAFLKSLEGVIKFWLETRLKKEQSHVMVTFRGRFNGETGLGWNILPLVYITDLLIKVRRCVGRWLEVLVE